MDGGAILRIVVWSAVLLLAIVVVWNGTRRRGPRGARVRRGPGPGAAGAIYDMLNDDKRRAIEIIVEGRAEQTDPEHADDTPGSGR